MQSKLLRAIQERCIRPLGSNQEEDVDVRIISATHKNLADEVQQGRFRQDLFYRLNVIDIAVPALRDRLEDLPTLCRALLARIAEESGLPVPALSAQALSTLASHPLRGNVRELENLLHRAVALCESDELELDTPQYGSTGGAPLMEAAADTLIPAPPETVPTDLQGHLDQQEREILVKVLKDSGYNRTLAAQRLGLSLRQIRYRIERLKIDLPGARDEPADD